MITENRLLKTIDITESRYRKRKKYRPQLGRAKEKPTIAQYINTNQLLKRLQYHGVKNVDGLFTDKITRERTIGTNDLLNINYLERGLLASRSVGRITINTVEGSGYGTGFLISHNLVLTNNHVIDSKATARESYIELNYQEDENFRPKTAVAFNFDPDKFFISSAKLDFTVVYVEYRSFDERYDLEEFGMLELIEETGKLQTGEWVSIIQHPYGRRKQVALRNNEVIDIFDNFVHYQTDTEPGSSGSPVFNEEWEVVGLHRSGVPKRDQDGNILNLSGKVWSFSEGVEMIRWVANEGVRTSAIIKHLRLNTNEKQKMFLRNILEDGTPVDQPFDDPTGTDTAYYQEGEDKAMIKQYYTNLDLNLGKEDLFVFFHELLSKTHKNQLSYKPSKYVYPEVDVHKDGKLRSIYSGKEFSVEELILADKRIDLDRRAKLLEVGIKNEFVSLDEYADIIDDIENSLPYNCEHVVPQSWYNKRSPMRGDLHHLFACDPKCNSFRSNHSYFDFADYNPNELKEAIRGECGKAANRKFEPEFNKGAVARATLYYLLRYPGLLEGNYDENNLQILLEWHEANPISLYEKHRNYKIHQMQGNRNPLIDFPNLAEKIGFKKGL